MANTKRKPAKGKPITSHPLFPAVVALWFGALFGLGSLAIRPSLFEGLVLKTGIDLVIPAAAPPLGVTARILISLVMSSFGALLGALLAWRIVRPKAEVRQRKRGAATSEEPARRPISAHDELGEGLDDQAEDIGFVAGRRRPLAVEPADEPFQPIDFAPLPGGQPQIFDVSAARFAEPDPAPVAGREEAPLDLGAFPAPTAAPIAPASSTAPPGPVVPPAPFAAPAPVAPAVELTPVAAPVAATTSIFGIPAQDGHVPTEFVRAAGFRTSVFDTEPAQPLFAERVTEQPAAGIEALAAAATPSVAEPAPPVTVAPAPTEPLPSPAGLGMTDLAARLQESMARRRAAKAAAAAVAVAPAASTAEQITMAVTEEPAEQPVAPLADAQPAPADFVRSTPPPIPAALRPIGFDHFDDEDPADLGILVPRHLRMPVPAAEAPAAATAAPDCAYPVATDSSEGETVDDLADTAHEEAFGSLLGLAPSGQRGGFVRIEEPELAPGAVEPVVIFPGQGIATATPFSAPISATSALQVPLSPFDRLEGVAPGTPLAATLAPAIDPAEAEQALRAALASLQRMSGAA